MSDDTEGRALVVHEERQSPNFLAAILAAAKDPEVDAQKVETMANLAVKLQDRERENEFNRDLNAAIMDMPVITKDGLIVIKKDGRVIQSTKFAKFEDIDRVVRPILRANNLALRFEVGDVGNQVSVRPILSHVNGHTEKGEAMRGPLDTSGSKNNVQGAGSTVSYLKRYTMCAALNIITEGVDDDGHQGRGEIVHMAHEREQLVLREAEEAHEAGRYVEHFAGLGPKDRAWLIGSGHHTRFGGQAALPSGHRQEPEVREIERDDRPPVEQTRPPVDQGGGGNGQATARGPAKPKPQTPAEWVKAFKGDLDRRTSIDALDEYMVAKGESLDKLKASDPVLWEETQQAYRDRRAAIEEGRLV